MRIYILFVPFVILTLSNDSVLFDKRINYWCLTEFRMENHEQADAPILLLLHGFMLVSLLSEN